MRLLKILLLISLLAAIGIGAWLYNFAKTPLHLSPEAQEITIAPKSSLRSIANQLVAQKVLPQALPFVLLARLTNKESSLQAGNYTVN